MAQPQRKRPPRRAARLAAVQALYQRDLNEMSPAEIVAEFITHRQEELGDRGFFGELVNGVAGRLPDIDGMVSGALSEGWTVERLEAVLRAILRAGVFELLERKDVPPRVIISEYVEIAHSFFAGREPAMVNGVLDKLAHVLRAEEL